ncbi:MAG: DUF5686 and carboxypeptidase regulatory-like domain-containing protein [Bacteroidales bacterium]
MSHSFAGHRIIITKTLFQVLLLSLITASSLESQTLKGRITDKSGQPVQYATVFIQELKHGTTSNAKGDYEIKLPTGKYTVFYQSLGYESVIVNIGLSDSTLIRDIILPEQLYEIPEVLITPSGEDPAYVIMRRAIGFAPYYLNQVSYYKANVYLKGNLLIKRIPKLLQKTMRMNSSERNTSVSAGGKPEENSRVLKEGDSFLMESYNEIEFTAPDKYVQKVISFNTSFPEEGNDISPMDYIQASFYQPVLVDMAISPLSPQAFSYYKFKYLGASLQGKYVVDKIEVIPRRKSQQLFSGTIYIVDDLWCLHSVDLTNENLAGTIRVRELYIPVEEDIWMPVSHQFDIGLAILGIRADAGYGSSVKYLEVRQNTNLQKPSDLASVSPGRNNVPDTVRSKTTMQIEKILSKEEMTNRDMIKLSNLMKKESEKSVADSLEKNLEIVENVKHIIEKDAGKKDSAYWAEIRPIPLSEIELRTLKTSDSIRRASRILKSTADTLPDSGYKKRSRFRQTFDNIVFGHTWSDTSGFSFTNGGLFDLKNLSFNTVDGFVYGVDFRFSKRYKSGNSLSLYPDIRYGFSREKLMLRANVDYSSQGMKPGRFFISSGITSTDLNTAGGINKFLNTVSSLVFKENYLKLYESRYLRIGYGKEVRNGLNLEFSAGFENRILLGNNTDFSIFNPKKEYTENIPVNGYLAPVNFSDGRHYDFVTNVTITPFQKYRISNGNKIPRGSDWPVLKFTWKHTVNSSGPIPERTRNFDMFMLEVSRRRDIGAFSQFRWKIRTGAFADNRYVPYFDFFHFNAQPVIVLIDDYDDAFMLPEYYSLSTPEAFGEAHIKYTAPYILLKLLPGFSNTLIRENLSFSFLASRFQTTYTEIGYSLSEIFFLGEIGVYAGFRDMKYSNFGVKFTLRLN